MWSPIECERFRGEKLPSAKGVNSNKCFTTIWPTLGKKPAFVLHVFFVQKLDSFATLGLCLGPKKTWLVNVLDKFQMFTSNSLRGINHGDSFHRDLWGQICSCWMVGSVCVSILLSPRSFSISLSPSLSPLFSPFLISNQYSICST